MKKLIVISHSDDYTVSGTIRYLIKMFYEPKIIEMFNQNGFDIITSKFIKESLNMSEIDYLRSIEPTDDYLIFGIHPYGLDTSLNSETKIKKVIWQDDLHYFANYEDREGASVQLYQKKYDPKYIKDIDYMITPSSIYFKNLDINKYNDKIIDLFYFLNEDYFDLIGNEDFKDRIPKVVLSGVIGKGYASRIEFDDLRSETEFDDLIYKISHPGYVNNEHMTELNYYNELTKYKSAFVGHYIFPINFLLSKHIEVLMCGCLGFFEPNPLLKEQLGLVEWLHYIPCYDENGLIKDINFYKKWMNSEKGKTIADNGRKYVRREFGKKQIMKLISFLKTV